MDMKLNSFIKGSILIAALFIMASCGKPKDLKYGIISNVQVKSFSFTGVDVEATLPIENPNGYTINVQDADMNILSDDKVIAHVKQSYPVVLPGKTKGDYKIGAFISLVNKSEIMSIMNLINGKTNLNLDGTVKVRSSIFTKNIKVHETGIQNYLKPALDQMKLF